MTEEKRQLSIKDKKKNESSIIRCFCKLSENIRKKAKNGALGVAFGKYTKINEKIQTCMVSLLLGKASKTTAFMRKIRLMVSEQFEESKILKIINRLAKFFLGCKLRLYSTFFMTFGIYTGLVYFLKKVMLSHAGTSESMLTFACITFLVSIPLFFTRKNLAEALKSSKIGNFIVCEVMLSDGI